MTAISIQLGGCCIITRLSGDSTAFLSTPRHSKTQSPQVSNPPYNVKGALEMIESVFLRERVLELLGSLHVKSVDVEIPKPHHII